MQLVYRLPEVNKALNMPARRSGQSRVIADPKRDFVTFFSQKTWKKTIFVHFSESNGVRYGQRF